MTPPPSRHLIQIRPRQRYDGASSHGLYLLRRSVVALLTALTLAGCVETAGQTKVASLEGPVAAIITAPATGESVKPGPDPVDLVDASNMFVAVCVTPYPNLKASEAEIRKRGFLQASTGTWFHQQLDLSIKLIPERRACSMVFGSRENAQQLGLVLGAAASSNQKIAVSPSGVSAQGPNGSTFRFGETSRMSNRTYFHAVLFK